MDKATAQDIARLIHQQRWAALATLSQGKPHASMVAYCEEPSLTSLLLHLSRLAPHTRNLLEYPSISLTISEPDDGRADPQTLARLSIEGQAVEIPRDSTDYITAHTTYLGKLPASEQLFHFGDFSLFRIHAATMRYVGGFGNARNLSPVDLHRLAHDD